jgi:adenylate cyclase
MSATPDSTSADPEQRMADLERQLAESKAERDVSKAERDEALQRETATAEVLQVINSSPGNLTPVFDAMLEKAIRLCGGDRGVLWTIEGGRGRLAAARGLPAEFVALLRERAESGTNSPLQRVLQGEWLIEFPDTVEEFSRSGDPHAKGAVEAGVRSAIWVAIVKEGVTVGAFAIGRSVIGTFSDKQIALLQTFAAQAVIAMENARLLTETREALEQQTATAEVLQVINSSPGDLTPVFDAILEKATGLCESAFGILGTYDGTRFRHVALRNVPAAYAEFVGDEPRIYALATGPAQAVEQKRVICSEDLMASDVYQSGDPNRRALVDLAGARTSLVAPLLKDDQALGLICVFRQEVRPFTDKQIGLLKNFAAQAVIAMENARLLGELRERTDQVAELNRGLEARVAEQVEELGRVGRLKRFLAPQLAELIVSQGDEKILESHRREIVVVFCDLRGYTAFAETAEPEEVLDFLREYHGALGPLVSQFEGTLDQFSGDGIMVFFNDPVPVPDAATRAVNMAVAMREAAGTLIADWRERGRDLGFGAGIAQGYATLGQIGFSERSGYTAIGTVCNVAARLCAEAKDGQILLTQRVNVSLRGSVVTEQVGALTLKGLAQPVVAYNVPLPATQPALRVIEGGPQGH